MKRLWLIPVLVLSLCLMGCEDTPVAQLDYSTLDMSPYGTLSPHQLTGISLTISQEWAYTEKDWQDYLSSLLATYPKTSYLTEGEVGEGDTILMSITATWQGEELFSYTDEVLEYPLSGGEFMQIEGFRAHLVGATLGETLSFSIFISPDHTVSWLAGREVSFSLTPVSIKKEEVLSSFDSDYILHTLGWQTTLTHPEEVVDTFLSTLKEEWQAAKEEDLHHAKEDALLSYLASLYTPISYPTHDLTYNLTALVNYYEGCREYDNQILTTWGSGEDTSPSLSHYLMRTYGEDNPLDAISCLVEEAQELTRENMMVAAAFHALSLSLPTPSSDPYENNLAMYDLTLSTLLTYTTFTFS